MCLCRTVTWPALFDFSPLCLLKCLLTISLKWKVFMQNSDLASLGRRTGAIETLVGQLREAAEATNLPHDRTNQPHQEEGKGDFIHLIPLIQLVHWPKRVSKVIFLFIQLVQSDPSIKFICLIRLCVRTRERWNSTQTANKHRRGCNSAPFTKSLSQLCITWMSSECNLDATWMHLSPFHQIFFLVKDVWRHSCTFVLQQCSHQHLWFRGRQFCPKQITVGIKFPDAAMLSYLSRLSFHS